MKTSWLHLAASLFLALVCTESVALAQEPIAPASRWSVETRIGMHVTTGTDAYREYDGTGATNLVANLGLSRRLWSFLDVGVRGGFEGGLWGQSGTAGVLTMRLGEVGAFVRPMIGPMRKDGLLLGVVGLELGAGLQYASLSLRGQSESGLMPFGRISLVGPLWKRKNKPSPVFAIGYTFAKLKGVTPQNGFAPADLSLSGLNVEGGIQVAF